MDLRGQQFMNFGLSREIKIQRESTPSSGNLVLKLHCWNCRISNVQISPLLLMEIMMQNYFQRAP